MNRIQNGDVMSAILREKNNMPSGIYQHKKGYKRPPRSKEWRRKLGLAHKGKIISPECREKLSKAHKGRKHSWGWKIGNALKGRKNTWSIPPLKKGKNHYNWKGGRSSLKERIRSMAKYKEWRLRIFQRDEFRCKFCDKKNNTLQADHYPISLQEILDNFSIKTIEDAEKCDILWDTKNGRTLCKECHILTENYLWKSSPQNKK